MTRATRFATAALLVAALSASGYLVWNRFMAAPKPAFADIAYGTASAAQTLDIHLPEGAGPFPFVVSIHGGAFKAGDKAQERPSDQVLAKGIAIVFINYRLTGEAIWPAQGEDVLAAIAHLRANAGRFGLDPERFAVMGQSAGGFLAVSAGLSLVEAGTPPGAVINFYGPMDFATMDADMQALGRTGAMGATDAAGSAESVLIGKPVGDNRAEATAMGPVGRLAAMPAGTRLPPLMIRHGDADPLIAHGQAERLRDAWAGRDPASPIDIEILAGAGHGGDAFESDAMQAALAGFLAARLTGG